MFRRPLRFAAALLGILFIGTTIAPAAEPQFASRFNLQPLGVAVQVLSTGDVNGDGHLDLACTHTGPNITTADHRLASGHERASGSPRSRLKSQRTIAAGTAIPSTKLSV